PLVLGEKVMAAIGLRDYAHAHAYDKQHLEILTTIAAEASVALENARLFEETRRRAEHMRAINDVERLVTTTLDLELLFKQLAQVLHSKLKLPGVAIGLIEGDELVFRAAGGYLADTGEIMDTRVKIGAYGPASRVAASGE